MPAKSQYELDREANIAKNRALFEDLGLKDAVKSLGTSKTSKTAAKPVQPKRVKRERPEVEAPRRQSRRLLSKGHADPDETPEERKIREGLQQKELERQEEERLEAEERARMAKRPRHDVLNFKTLVEENEPQEISQLSTTMQSVIQTSRRVGDPEAFTFSEESKHNAEVKSLREEVRNLKVVSRAKVTINRVYCAAYHPEVTKDLIFFGDKHGQLGIWDARAPPDEEAEDDDVAPENREGGKYWRLQLHWPASPKSSISTIKLDPIDSHNLYTSSYDCTIRSTSFVSGISKEVYATQDGILITSLDLPPDGHEMWISDGAGGITHLDLRQDKSKARRYALSDAKIGSISVNPTRPNFLLTASNSRFLKIWDTRKLQNIPVSLLGKDAISKDESGRPLFDFESNIIEKHFGSANGKGGFRGEFRHEKSASSSYWDPRGRQIVSTSYDDRIRIWDIDSAAFKTDNLFPNVKPFCQIKHNCQTGKWLTILRAQWSPNPDCYPHFTVGNMDHSLDIYSSKGELITQLSDRTMISAVQAVTCSHPSIIERAASGNASGRCILWAPASVGLNS
ncbi:WD40-repeat-containing domain protein [Gymnopilus junonius]|uniref:DNA damage-binding protein CMR1 n=1 Tax=Gymnopilus junonius TaxID=109634 RepID=A0A9P5P0T0_GYMJU|nr:WD40-repeat-containing domain protein [Gymnopilus junonius]